MLTVEADVKTSEELDFDDGDSDKFISTMSPEPPSRSEGDESRKGCGCTFFIVIISLGLTLWLLMS